MSSENKIRDDILSYREMCDAEEVQTLQRGMNFRMRPSYSVILMSQRPNAPYHDRVTSGKLTQNGLFAHAVVKFKSGNSPPQLVKVYEKIFRGVWSLKGYFDLIDYKIIHDGSRKVFRYILRLSDRADIGSSENQTISQAHTRLIPSEVKKEVWKRDGGRCVMCGETKNCILITTCRFRRGTSISAKNVRLLCMKHNLQKSAKIE